MTALLILGAFSFGVAGFSLGMLVSTLRMAALVRRLTAVRE